MTAPAWRLLYLRVCVLPAALWLGARVFTRDGEGWNGFARGMVVYPLLVTAIVSSALLGLGGAIAWMISAARGRVDLALGAATIVASAVAVYASYHR